MIDFEKVLFDLVLPLADDKESISVKEMATLDENEILLYVYANNSDISRLIGKKGAMASDIRHMMAIGSRKVNKRINIKFESY
ncbi:MAG: KH domain-containing protein [Erysipelotrichaceae bacterium]